MDIENPKALLLPGAYVFVHLPLPADSQSLTIPSNALLFRQEGLRVGVVRDGRVQLVPISIGHDLRRHRRGNCRAYSCGPGRAQSVRFAGERYSRLR